MLSWFDQNPNGYWWLLLLMGGGAIVMLLRTFLRPDWQDERNPDWGWSWVIAGLLAAGRWPTWFLTKDFNSDESQFIAGAITLRHDPVFWRSVDGMTVGPLDFYALLPIGGLVDHDGYFSARVTACLFLALALIFVHQTLALVFGRQVARISTFSAICLEALTIHKDFLHYSSELVPMVLIAAAFFIFARRLAAKANWKGNVVAGLALGAIPLAKLQAAPPAAVLGLAWMILEFRGRDETTGSDWWKGLIALAAGAAAPTLLCAILVTTYDLWDYATIAYVRHNIAYIDEGSPRIGDVLTSFRYSAIRGNSLLPQWLAGGLVWLLISLPLAKTSTRPSRLIAGSAMILLLTTLVAVLLPSRAFLHYCQLLVIPWTLVVGATTGLIVDAEEKHRTLRRGGVLCGALLCTISALLYARTGLPAPGVGRLASSQANPQSSVAHELNKYAAPSEALGIWGWMTHLYIETGLRQATRRADSSAEIPSSPFSDYFRTVYLADLQRSAPPVFVDATGPGNQVFTDRMLSFDVTFPALADYIHSHYVFAKEVEGTRIYVRRDRWIP